MALSERDLLSRLDAAGIAYGYYAHPPVMTVAETASLTVAFDGFSCKCLFLRGKDGRFWLVAVPASMRVNLKALATALQSGRLAFADENAMLDLLGVTPGSVTALAAVNDTQNLVTVVLEESLLTEKRLLFHPLVNTASVAVAPADVIRFLESTGHSPVTVNGIALDA